MTIAKLLARLRSRGDGALVPADTAASRALVAVVAILSFLASLAAGGAEIATRATRDWRGELASEATVQVRPVAGRDLEGDLRRAADIARRDAAVAAADPLSVTDTARLLEPWLGGLELSDLPVPRLVVLRLKAGASLEGGTLRATLREAVPSASLDDHGAWQARLTRFGASVAVFAVGVTLLILAAAAAAVAFATAGAVADNREVVDVLRLVGASDAFIAAVFQSRFWRLGMRGGSAGALVASFLIVAGGTASAHFGAGDAGNLLGSFGMGPFGFAAIAAVPPIIAIMASLVSRRMVRRYLSVS